MRDERIKELLSDQRFLDEVDDQQYQAVLDRDDTQRSPVSRTWGKGIAMRILTSCSHDSGHARKDFLRVAKEQAREQSLQLRRVIGPVKKALWECGCNGDPLADVRKQPQTLRHQLWKAGIVAQIPPHIYAPDRDAIDPMVDAAVQTHQGPI